MWQKIKKWFRNSLTIAWARLGQLIGAAVAVVAQLNIDPNFTDTLHSVLTPRNAGLAVLGMMVVTEIARRRTAKKAQ